MAGKSGLAIRAWAGAIALSAMLAGFGAGSAAAQTPDKTTRGVITDLKTASCPQDVKRVEPDTISLAVKAVPLQGVNPRRRAVGQLSFAGGFHLTSPDARFGGLSGLDVLDDGRLLAVSDTGEFVWISLGEDGVTPVEARLAGMRDETGAEMGGKSASDAEGLAMMDGLALVSFEGTHRVLAFDMDGCGAAARGAPVFAGEPGEILSAAFARQSLKVGANDGVEALAIAPDGFVFAGLEAKTSRGSAVSARPVGEAPEFDVRIGIGARELVGLDILPDDRSEDAVRVFSLHRSSNPLASNAITIVETRFVKEVDKQRDDGSAGAPADYTATSARVLAEMSLFLTIDNFEGIAARQMPDGRVRLYVVSDDNFSASQRTLLMVYDLEAQG